MLEQDPNNRDEISVFAIGTLLLSNRWRLARWTLAGALLALVLVFNKAPMYQASSTFMPQVADPTKSGLASLAGQFGVSIPGTSASQQSPEFYSALLRSRLLLGPVVADSFVVAEDGGKRVGFLELFRVPGGAAAVRAEKGIDALAQLVTPNVNKSTGVVEVAVTTRWPSVSLAIVQRLVAGINDFNQHIRQSQAAAERAFVEGRLKIAAGELRNAEDRLQQFLSTNRQFASAELALERERLQRDVTMQSQVYASLRQNYEDARIREVRDIPVITLIEPPMVSSIPQPRGRVKAVLFGAITGTFIGILLIIVSEAIARRRAAGDPDAAAFFDMAGDLSIPMVRRERSMKKEPA